MSEKFLVEKIPLKIADQYLALITLNRPKEMNPLDWDLTVKMKPEIDKLSTDKSVRVIAVTGAGKAFSAGGDLKKYITLMRDEDGLRGFLQDCNALFYAFKNASQPVIALVNGFCVAGGLELLLSTDFAYAGESAKIGDGHVNFGQVGGAGSQSRLPRKIYPARAMELLFTGELFSAQEAMEWGLINKVVPDDKLVDAAMEFANKIVDKSALGARVIKKLVNESIDLDEEAAVFLESQMVHHYCLTSHDCHEGLSAFDEKRKPKFKGR